MKEYTKETVVGVKFKIGVTSYTIFNEPKTGDKYYYLLSESGGKYPNYTLTEINEFIRNGGWKVIEEPILTYPIFN